MAFQQQRQPYPNTRFVEEEGTVDDRELGNPFARDIPRGRGRRPADTGSQWWEAGLKIDIPEFQGGLQAKKFQNWILLWRRYLINKQVPLIATHF